MVNSEKCVLKEISRKSNSEVTLVQEAN